MSSDCFIEAQNIAFDTASQIGKGRIITRMFRTRVGNSSELIHSHEIEYRESHTL